MTGSMARTFMNNCIGDGTIWEHSWISVLVMRSMARIFMNNAKRKLLKEWVLLLIIVAIAQEYHIYEYSDYYSHTATAEKITNETDIHRNGSDRNYI